MTGRALRWLLSVTRPTPVWNGGPSEGRLIIIRHHRVYADDERPLYRLGVSETVFSAQLDVLARERLTPITVSEGLARLRSGARGCWVALSFDDGYADNVWRALTRLQMVSGRATFYLTAGLIEERRAPWWDELAHALTHTRQARLDLRLGDRELDLPLRDRRERLRALHVLAGALRVPPTEREHRLAALRMRLGMSESAPCELATWDTATALVRSGMEVGAHTMTHPHLTTLDAGEQEREIADSVDLIEHRLGARPAGLAYPGGDYDGATLRAVGACRLGHAVTTRPGANASGVSNFELLRRGLSDGACLGPSGHFSRRLALAELAGTFDRLRGVEAGS
jgi:peptidoglycan/xylan/chitin deacetylase (PgdA/CDA1 family)